ncbi:TetR/AcrR family transcriptional regulator C-terminal domain-containing protein [Microbacterium sp. SA39]|uniref:TetR/AcrR family transcriptional regulator C-terminal domain-containing protein n=1 Tax=Microbacterium sp. SA39 TaxID=1263625 RepID=UPI0005F9C735|nr:TetR/AcrR family transcriptional regulator C-terminal domain-containing protein [Microbacterium sp. SA39]KJQ55998.1 Tetracycline repressor protein class E [Microbacterium sp. SA39]
MAERSQERSHGSSAGRLSRELIIGSALEQIDSEGAQSLSMRSLAQGLGVEAMSLYRYVRGREDLLEGVTDRLMGDLTAGLDAELTEHWQGFLQTLAHRVRRIAIDHPRAFPLVASRPPSAPWLRPPLRSVELVETFLSTLIDHGFSDEQAVKTYRSFSSFLLGQLLLEAAVRGGEIGPLDEPSDEGDAASPDSEGQTEVDESAQIVRLRDLLSEDRSDEEFEASLESLLDRLSGELAV